MEGQVQLLSLIEQSKLDSILDAFTQATGVAAIITNVDGTPITKSFNFTNLCQDFCRRTEEGRQRCYKSDSYGGRESVRTQRQIIYPCLNAGLLDSAAPINVGGHHVGNTLCGQVLDAPVDEKEAVRRAEAIGIEDIDGYLESLACIPIIPLDQFQAIVRLMHVVTNTISEIAYQKRLLYRRSRRYLGKLVNCVSENIVSANNRGIITMVNDACMDTFGVPKDRLLGRPFSSLLADEDSMETVKNHLKAQLGTGVRSQVQAITETGAVFPMQVSVSSIKDEDGHTSDYVAVMQDITEEKRIERMKEDLVGMLTHDLGNPVLSMQKALQLIMGEGLGPLNTAQKEMLELTLQTGNQLYGMVTDFLDTYRHENGQLRLRKIDCDLTNLLQESIHQVDLFAKDKKLDLNFSHPDEPAMCSLDFNRIKRVATNILENAIQYSPKYSTIELNFSRISGAQMRNDALALPKNDHDLATAARRFWLISISDEGLGIPEGVVPYIFDKFFTTSQRSRQGRKGVGLGLAFCKLAIEAHGGRIWVKTPLYHDKVFKYRGCQFNFCLPA